MALLNVDLEILQETKLTHNIYMQSSAGYRVVSTEAVSTSQGNITLFCRRNNFTEVEEFAKHSPNVITV